MVRLRLLIYILSGAVVMLALWGLASNSHNSVSQEVEEVASDYRHFLYATSGDDWTKPYVLVTTYKGEVIRDYGTFQEIKSIKCQRITDIKIKAYKSKKEREKWEKEHKKVELELKQLNKDCNF
jgi:hypothetical protein